MDHTVASATAPWPELKIVGADPVAARAMLSNIGGDNSEMSAVGLYFYNSIVTEPEDAVLARTFHAVMLVEMHHLELFAKLALQLGADPRLWSQQRRRMLYWSPRALQYPLEREELLENALRTELTAIAQYQQQMDVIGDPNIRAILGRVIEDEQLHVDLFAALMEGKDPDTVLRRGLGG